MPEYFFGLVSYCYLFYDLVSHELAQQGETNIGLT